MTQMAKVTSLILKQLRKAEWQHTVDREEDRTIIRSTLDLIDTECCDSVELVFDVQEDDVLVVGIPRVTVRECRRNAVALYLMDVDWSLRYGKVVVSRETGEVHFEHLIHSASITANPTDALIEVFATVSAVLESCLPQLFKMLTGVFTPQEAFEDYKRSSVAPKEDDADSTGEVFCRHLTSDDYIRVPAGVYPLVGGTQGSPPNEPN